MQKSKTTKLLIFTIFTLVIVFGVGKGEKVEAADELGTCQYRCHFYNNFTKATDKTLDECALICADKNITGCDEIIPRDSARCQFISASSSGTINQVRTKRIESKNDICAGVELLDPQTWINCILLVILEFLSWLLAMASTIFTMAIDPQIFHQLLGEGNKIIYPAWAMVRDILNISFIMFLLFSAFATVFQIEKYSYKKILLTLVIMALLVNFSYPIARFIIDLSNMMMFYFINALDINSTTFFAKYASDSDLGKILTSEGVKASTTSLLAAVIFTFVFTISLFTMAIMMIIRVIALAILIIFSSLAFIGTAIPPLTSYANDWWKKLFSYAFFGPIMLFMLYVSTQIMKEMSDYKNDILKIATKNTIGDSNLIASMAYFSIPIIIIWLGLGIAQSMSIAGAGAVVGKAQGFMKGAGKWASGASFVGGAYKAYQSRRAEAGKDSWRNRLGTFAGSKQDQFYGGVVPGKGGRDAQMRHENDQRKKVEDETKRRDTANASTGNLQTLATNGNKFEKAAAIQELANRGQATAAQLQEVGRNFGETSQVFSQLVSKVKAYDPVAAFSTAVNATGQVTAFNQARLTEHINSNQFDAKKVNADSLGNQDFMRIAFENNAITNKDLEDLRGNSVAHRTNIQTSLGNIATGATDVTNETHRNIQMAHLAQTGNIQNTAFTDRLYQDMDKDTAKRMSAATLSSIALNPSQFLDNTNAGKYKDIILNMQDRAVQRQLNQIVRTTPSGTLSAQGRSVQNLAQGDSLLRNI
jgi:hypothetical protein